MSGGRSGLRAKALEALLWGLALAAGAFVFVPSVLELLEGNRLKAEEKERLLGLEDELRETDRRLSWALQDPEADEKLYEKHFGRPYISNEGPSEEESGESGPAASSNE